MANIPEIPVVIDTNVWSDLRRVLNLVQAESKKDYKKIWEEMETNGRFIEETLKNKQNDLHTYRGVIKTMKQIIEMKKSPKKYVVEVPSYVFNEAGRSVSSKISSNAQGSNQFVNGFRGVLKSLPIAYHLDDTVLQEGTHYPGKTLAQRQTVKGKMREFLSGNQEAPLVDLLNHLKNPDDAKTSHAQNRSNILKDRINAVYRKRRNWDQFMTEASQVLGFTYETKTKALSALSGSIRRYRDTDDIFFKSVPASPGSGSGTKLQHQDPLDVLAERLTMAGEEYDFFDLQIYLYAKKKKAHIITMNTQAYQEINDPSFLGYFEDIKILHPLINFDTLKDFEKSGDLVDIIKESIISDFKVVDMQVCKELDSKLANPVMVKEGGNLINEALSRYKPDSSGLDIDVSLGSVLKVLRIQNKKLKVSRESFFEDDNGSLIIGRVAKTLKFIDKQLFSNKLTSSDFVKSLNSNVDYVLKSKVLKDYLNNNPRVKEKLNMFRTRPGDYLNDLLSTFRKRSFIDIQTHLALSVQSHFSDSEINGALGPVSRGAPLPSSGCPQSRRLGKREAGKCLLEWEQIEKFNEEKVQNRDPRKVKINSEKFLEYVKTIEDPLVRSQLIEFTDKVLNSGEHNMNKISGSKVDEVTHLVNNQKVLNHFSKVYRVSSALNYGIFAKSLLGDILHGDIEGIAVNTGFLAGNYGFGRLASASLAKGLKYAEAGKVMLGNSLKFASPFIGRFLSPLIALDLYNQIQALKAGDQDAIVGIVGDSIFLAIDAVEVGITLLEISGLIGEVSAVTGPIGWALGALVIIGTDIYFAVRKVQSLDQIIHLTTGEKWKVGAGSFFSFGLATFDVERLAHIKVGNNDLAKKALEAIKNNQDVQRIVIPSAYTNENNEIEMYLSNAFHADVEPSKIKWDRVRPDDPAGGTIFCAPQGDWEDPKGVTAICVNAIGVADKVTKDKNYTLFNLGDGNDFVKGFKDSSNIFRIGKGKKQMIGGDKSDVFVLEEGTTFKDFPEGFVDGKGGSNVFDFRGLKGEGNDAVSLAFKEDPMGGSITHVTNYKTFLGKSVLSPRYSTQNLKILGIDSIIGRENGVDLITTNCNTKFVDSKGGRSDEPDVIYIRYSDEECNHDKIIQLGPHTVVVNEAMAGKFSYFVNDVHSNIRCTLKRKTEERNDTDGPPVIHNNPIEHKFFINGTLSDIYNFNFQFKKGEDYDIAIGMYFKDETGKINRFYLDTILGYGKTEGAIYNIMFYLKDNVQLGYHHKGIYALLKSDLPVDDIIKKYQPIAIAFGISVFIYAEEEGAMVSIGSDQADDMLNNDPSYKTYLIGNKGNNFYTITSGQDFLQDPPTIPKIEIHSSDRNNHIDTLDLRSLSKQIKEDLGEQLLIKHSFHSDKLVLNLYTSDKLSYHDVTTITLKNDDNPPNWDSWCNSLQIILNNAPVILKCDKYYQTTFGKGFDYERDFVNYDPSNYYRPFHLVFSHEDLIVIKEEDVEPYTEVYSKNKLVHNRFLRLENDLVMTNGFEFDTPNYSPTTVVLKNYYKSPTIFNTLKFIFKDRIVSIKKMESKINGAEKLEDYHNEYANKFNNIIDHQTQRNKRDLGTKTSEEPSSSSEVIESRFSVSSVFGSVAQSLSNIYYTSLTYVQDYYVYMVESKPKHTLSPLQNFGIDFSNDPRVQNERILESNSNAASSNENEIAFTDVNSTLLLLDTLVRKLNDSKQKQPVEDYLLSPQEQVEKKMVQLSSKLELDLGDIEGSLEKQQQRILDNLQED